MMCDPAACVSFMYVSQCASGLFMLTWSLASALYVWGRVCRTLELHCVFGLGVCSWFGFDLGSVSLALPC